MIAALAARQFNRVSRAQLDALGVTRTATAHRVAAGRLTIVEQGVFAIAPALDDPWGRWMAATLTAPSTFISHDSSAVAYAWLGRERSLITVTRPGNGGPRRHGGLLVYRRMSLEGEVTELRGIPITSPERTLLDLATCVSSRALARAIREAVRLNTTSLERIMAFLGPRRSRRGARRLARAVELYAGIPIGRARSATEVRAMIVLRDANLVLPKLNVDVAGIEADLVWRRQRRIIEIDGGEFHLDRGEDARKERVWRGAGFQVDRIDANDVWDRPHLLLGLAPFVPRGRP
jgi:hypothetical protein